MPRVYHIGSSKNSLFSGMSANTKLILINVAAFFAVIIASFFYPMIINYVALKPSDFLQGKNVWTLFTHFFMHGGLLHLFINMFVLFSLGGMMEKIIGTKRYVGFYLLSGLFAGLLFVLLAGLFGDSSLGARIFGEVGISAVGASGAIFAIAGLFVVLLPNVRFSIIFFPFFSLPGYIMVPLVLVVTWIASSAGGLPIGNVAHFGGFLAGLGYGFYLKNKYKNKIKVIRKYFR
jgi:membrane associated rhomboid family serine protease